MMKKTALLLACAAGLHFNTHAQTVRHIHADASRVTGPMSNVFNHCVGAGRANEGLRADWQQQLTELQHDMHFKYIRFHGLLNDDMRVYMFGKDGKPVYNWQYIDKLYDFLLSVHIRPVVELGFMPTDLAAGTKTVFWWKGNVSKPKSYNDWDELIRHLVTHFKERYGQAEVAQWYFEVWNEPDIHGFWDGTQADYFELYAHTAKAVKSVSTDYRVGGPATSAIKWIDDFLKYCTDNKLPVDFVSTHDYATSSVLDEFGTKKQRLKANADSVAGDVAKVRHQVDISVYKNAQLLFTEWNMSPSSRDAVHDTYQNAAFALHVLNGAMPYANSMSYWTFTDIFEEAGPAVTPFHGGFGLFNLQGIRKPTYYAYKYLSELGPERLKADDDAAIICKNKKSIQALFWDFTFPTAPNEYDQDAFAGDRPSSAKAPVELSLNHLANGKYRCEVYRTGYQLNDPYSQYIAWGKPSQLTIPQVDQLKALSSGRAFSSTVVTVTNGLFKKQFPLRSNDIYLVKLTPLNN